MEALMKVLGGLGAAVVLLLIVACFIGLPVMWLWNALLPELFGLPTVSFSQAVGLYVLGNLISGGTSGTSSSTSSK